MGRGIFGTGAVRARDELLRAGGRWDVRGAAVGRPGDDGLIGPLRRIATRNLPRRVKPHILIRDENGGGRGLSAAQAAAACRRAREVIRRITAMMG